ncbi:hypothetical protein MKZ38_009117 [Zalerion maritima]|uniref:Uncharacterized protein n=1 Tax=Zalerion maritima TaxID=339359 RepID=A0AAD5WNQ1_9PEZI|nr:hypothetical protein MKZ38_009117 [Zalerion maritima]
MERMRIPDDLVDIPLNDEPESTSSARAPTRSGPVIAVGTTSALLTTGASKQNVSLYAELERVEARASRREEEDDVSWQPQPPEDDGPRVHAPESPYNLGHGLSSRDPEISSVIPPRPAAATEYLLQFPSSPQVSDSPTNSPEDGDVTDSPRDPTHNDGHEEKAQATEGPSSSHPVKNAGNTQTPQQGNYAADGPDIDLDSDVHIELVPSSPPSQNSENQDAVGSESESDSSEEWAATWLGPPTFTIDDFSPEEQVDLRARVLMGEASQEEIDIVGDDVIEKSVQKLHGIWKGTDFPDSFVKYVQVYKMAVMFYKSMSAEAREKFTWVQDRY